MRIDIIPYVDFGFKEPEAIRKRKKTSCADAIGAG